LESNINIIVVIFETFAIKTYDFVCMYSVLFSKYKETNNYFTNLNIYIICVRGENLDKKRTISFAFFLNKKTVQLINQ